LGVGRASIVATLPAVTAARRQTHSKTLDELRRAAHVHVDFIAAAKRREALPVWRVGPRHRGGFTK
jgi:hypothetical protein